jgi:hypothetical protein
LATFLGRFWKLFAGRALNDGADCWSKRAGCYAMGEEYVVRKKWVLNSVLRDTWWGMVVIKEVLVTVVIRNWSYFYFTIVSHAVHVASPCK